ncbi:SDR family oxidoreductase [Clostridiaceae bacterium]|nr:SDR family oxidoreductase [Clostridiaceae bacterium]RKI17906.1 SDR family oxidoreductase [bacterium 1XD21-70]
MDLQLKGKNVVITASTDGIGYAVAHKFLEEGACVLINGRNEFKAKERKEVLEQEFGKDKVYLYSGDTTIEEKIIGFRKYAEEIFGHIDCLVANVGSGKPVSQDCLDIEGWKKSFEVNLFSAVQLIEVFDDLWEGSVGGSIITVSSLAAYNRISAPYAYAAAKQGISVLSKYLSDDYAMRKIRVNSVIPGNVFYNGGRWEELLAQDEAGVRKYIETSVPLRRFAVPEEIANGIVFLASDCASFITGATLLIDGGQSRTII